MGVSGSLRCTWVESMGVFRYALAMYQGMAIAKPSLRR
jgi:hypothetical protein